MTPGSDRGAGAGSSLDPEQLKGLPREVRVRIRDLPRHLRALRLLLSRTTVEQLEDAMRSGDEEVLIAQVYPVERAFELIDNHIGELAEIGLEHAGETLGNGVENLRKLAATGVIPAALAKRLIGVHRARIDLQHGYPDVVAAGIYEAADLLANDVARFLSRYLRWLLRELEA